MGISKHLPSHKAKERLRRDQLKRLCREDWKEVPFPAHKTDASGCFKDYQTLNDTCHLKIYKVNRRTFSDGPVENRVRISS